MSDNQVITPVPQIPEVDEMEAQVKQVPQTQVPPNTSIQTSSQQVETNNVQQPLTQSHEHGEALEQIQLANSSGPEVVTPTDRAAEELQKKMDKARQMVVKALGILLTLQGLHGIYKSVIFILVEYPMLEQQLVAHQITQQQVNDFGIKAIMMVISTVISMFFAMKLTFLKTKAAKTVSTTIGILLFLGNALIHDYFEALNSSEIMVGWIVNILETIQGAPEEVIESTPFLEETIEGTVDTIWYK